jgi:hypothetical protein
MNESAADWVLFLDDDVVPDRNIVEAYKNAILAHGDQFDGFVGSTVLPTEENIFPTAVHLSDVSYFWTIADKMDAVPWGVTANLALIHAGRELRFDVDFIKTGGGEDIDIALRLEKWPLKSVPEAKCIHPWWNEGSRTYHHFYNWAVGDSLLIDKFPRFTYR